MAATTATATYGSWVVTWVITLQPAPVELRIVVSEIGEAWSPATAPASTAPRTGSSSSGASTALTIPPAIGSRSPKEPQLVPVAKAIARATRKTTGTSHSVGSEESSTSPPRYSPVPRESISEPSIHASSRMLTAGHMDRRPSHQPRPKVERLNLGLEAVSRE